MTPLLWDIVKQYGLPRSQRIMGRLDEIRPLLEETHSYDITAVSDTCNAIIREGHSPNGTYTFAPGRSVWLEARISGLVSGRLAYLVNGSVVWRFLQRDSVSTIHGTDLSLAFEPQMSAIAAYAEKSLPWHDNADSFTDIGSFRFIRAAFSIINRPRHVGLKVHQPHKGRIKKLNGTGFPLHCWHEITVGGRTKDHGGQQVESRMSGTRPYHHVRAHYKPTIGVVIPEHWRGDPSIGIKRTRYRVEKAA